MTVGECYINAARNITAAIKNNQLSEDASAMALMLLDSTYPTGLFSIEVIHPDAPALLKSLVDANIIHLTMRGTDDNHNYTLGSFVAFLGKE